LYARSSVGIDGLKRTITTADSVRRFPGVDARVTAPRAGCTLPEQLESPLDGRIERLRVDDDHAEIDELVKHLAEGRIRGGHTSSFGTVDRSYRGFPRFYTRADCINQQLVARLTLGLSGREREISSESLSLAL
jgi:hypothetical protein